MLKPGPIGILDQLTLEQQEELFVLYETHPAHVVVKMIGAPPPEGWGIVTHVTSVRRFYQRKQWQNLRSDNEASADMKTDDKETDLFRERTRAALTRHACQLALSSPADSKSANKAFRYMIELEKLEAKAQHLQLLRQRLALEQSKAQFDALFRASATDSALGTKEFRAVLKELREAVKPGGLLNPKTFPGFGFPKHKEDEDEDED